MTNRVRISRFLASMGLLLACLLALGTVAEAQQCLARASGKVPTVRAEGRTEIIADLDIRCRIPEATFGSDSDPLDQFEADGSTNVMVEIAVELNADITNAASDSKVDSTVTAEAIGGYAEGGINMGFLELGDKGVLNTTAEITLPADLQGTIDKDGNTITWEFTSTLLRLTVANQGFRLLIKGIRADASAVSGEITATMFVNDKAVHNIPRKVADVTDGVEVSVKTAKGLQCEAGMATATVTFVEGFQTAFSADHSLAVSLRNVPDNVSVKPSATHTARANLTDGSDLAHLALRTGDGSGVGDDGSVSLSTAGNGEIYYDFIHTPEGPGADNDIAATEDNIPEVGNAFEDRVTEWSAIELTFTWSAGETAIDSGTVSASFNPVGGSTLPRFVGGTTMTAVSISECTTSLRFPFMTNMYGFDTGVALTNASEANGTCMVEYSGTNAPAREQRVDIEAGTTKTFGVSVMAPDFQGYAEATCDFLDAEGFVFISNGFGSMGGPTAAQGYLAVEQ